MRLFEIDSSLDLLEKHKDAVQLAVGKYNKNKTVIYRGIGRYEQSGASVVYVDPTKREEPRRSANTYNYYTLWLDNDPAWANFPKRSYSLICTTAAWKARQYGDDFRIVIPLVDAKIGVCPESDIWNSFEDTLPIGDSLKDLMNYLHFAFTNQEIPVHSTMSYDWLIKSLDKLDTSKLKGGYLGKLFNERGARGAMSYILDPVKNKFKLTTWNQFKAVRDREIWLSAPCLYVSESAFMQLAKGQQQDQ